MNITLDHNCIIDILNKTNVGALMQSVIANNTYRCFVVNIGASEIRRRGAYPESYDRFEELLVEAGVDNLPRLNPMNIFDVTFWDRSVFANNRMIKLSEEINFILFGQLAFIEKPIDGIDSPVGRKWLNRLCDVHSMWCHIHNSNDIFLTNDRNFTKRTKLLKLIELGAGRICRPQEL